LKEEAAPLEVNVHFAEHEWVTAQPDAARQFAVRLLAELSRVAGLPVRVCPLLAYLDSRIDERDGLERLTAACAAEGLEVAEPRLLRPTNLDRLAAELAGAALTISSSYHVALTSLLLAIPAAIFRDNDYYAQKADGLLSDFDLPPEFSPGSHDDPAVVAEALGRHLFDPAARTTLRRSLEDAGRRARQRRVEAEAEVVYLVGRGMLTVPGGVVATPDPAPASGAEEAERRATETAREAAAAQAKLNEVLTSRSWRITEPLRRLVALFRPR
jgi:hypothetical protein